MHDTNPQLEALLETARQRYDVEFESLTVDESPLEILHIRNMRAHLDNLIANRTVRDPLHDLPLWAKIWPASFILGRFLRKLDPAGKTLLEVGAGSGVTGLIASRYGFSHVTVSDINEDALLFARANVLRNNLSDVVDVRRVDIATTRLEQRFDVIAGSEVLYLEELHRPLLKFIIKHLARRDDAMALLCTDTRRKMGRFFKQAERDFRIEEQLVGIRSTADDGSEERRVFTIHRLFHKHI